MLLPIVQYGHPILRKVSVDITRDYEGLDKLISDMWDTLYKAEGIGLAAPQIGRNIRLFLVDARCLKEDYPEVADFKRVFLNAHIIERSETQVDSAEGCLSLPGINETIKRSEWVKVRYTDIETFEEKEEVIKGYCAIVFQHEYDHLDGKVFTDHLGALKKRLLKGKLTSISAGKVPTRYRVTLP
jgi:peptide deformylase